MNDDHKGGGSFWTSIPGCLTGVAAIITAITGLVGVLISTGMWSPLSTPTSTLTAPQATASAVYDLSGCVLTIKGGNVALKEKPSLSSVDVDKIKPGDYSPLDYTEVPSTGETQQWFQIRVKGTTGWVDGSPSAIESGAIDNKTAGCP